ncbi:MAG: polysaccharide pyruvyl transferase family protein [Candidatus Peribacteraceae bacterium]|nr:polysaccharide pyruvyl transferase family protein [Candidatus Peribacteraceae bacterium]MDD5742005.1 polysaccharide pyruvyl transferase family protein [Candidatus Peribacteraceae bacterium]
MPPVPRHPLSIAYVSPGFEEGLTHASVNAMTAYALHLLSRLYEAIPRTWTLTVLTSHKRTPMGDVRPPVTETLTSPPIRVERCFRGNSFGFFRLWWTIRKRRFDVVHFQHETHLYGGPLSLALFPFFIAFTRLITVPVITLHHVVRPTQIDAAFARMHHTHIPPLFIRWGYRIFYRLLGLFAPSIIVHDDLFKQMLVQSYSIPREHITMIPHGVEDPTASLTACSREDLAREFHVPEDAKTIFGFFGYFTGYKGIDFLLEEFAEHIRKFPKSVLLIGGLPAEAHAEKKSYQAFVDGLKKLAETTAPGRVIWYGAVRDAQVGRYFRLVDCLVLPYRLCFAGSGPLSYAIGSSTPFLASEALRPLVPYESLLFPLRNGALAEKLGAFASLFPAEREALTVPLQILRDQHQWNVIARSTLETYERSLARAAHRTDILIVGAYGQLNTGDELLLARCLTQLPRDRCTVASAQPHLTEAQHHVFSIDAHRSHVTFLRHFLQARMIVVGGGDQFKLLKDSMERARYALLFQCFLLTLLGRLLRKRVLFISVGIGNISTPVARFLTIRTLCMATAVSFRERESYDFCRMSAPHARAFLSADLAFLKAPVTRNLEKPSHLHVLGIAPVFAIDHAEQYTHITRELGKATESFLGLDPRRSALFLPFQTGFSTHHDIIVSKDILAYIEQSHRCSLVEPFGIDRVNEAYRSIDMLWGMRLHSIILSCLFAVPFIALIYDVKVKKFLDSIDCASWGIALDSSFTAEHLLARQRQLEEHAEDIRHHLRKQAERLTGSAGISARLLKQVVAEVCNAPVEEREISSLPEYLESSHLPTVS